MNTNKEMKKNTWNKKITLVAMILCEVVLLTGCCLKHYYAAATCEMPETCIKCGKTQGTALGHDYKEATCEKAKTCARCGKTVGDALGHNYQEATCEAPKTCIVCGSVEGEALGHDFVESSCTEPSQCSRCGEEQPAAGHDYKPATCEEPKTCTKCNATEGEALGHNIKNGKCKVCGFSIGSLDYIASFIGRKSEVEENFRKCIVNVDTAANPYDVEYYYGEDYEEVLNYCDWSLVFDADYYKKTFPMLAMQYHNDDKLLLRHFQTVGIHEGRQGSEIFNVGAYLHNCSDKVYKAFHREDSTNYECYYLYYMLNYDTEKDVNVVTANDEKKVYKQYKLVLTQLQSEELKKTNEYRAEVNAEKIMADSELNAIANYRGYINQVEGLSAHEWLINHTEIGHRWRELQGSSSYAENMVESTSAVAKVCASSYYTSQSHYEAMVATKYKYVGLGNTYHGKNLSKGKNNRQYNTYTFDVYMTAVDASPLNRK